MEIHEAVTERRLAVSWLILLLLLAGTPVAAQSNFQLWGNVTVDWVKSERLTYELDFEPKVLVSAPAGAPAWRNLDVTPNVEYAAKSWLDLIAELPFGYTKQTDDLNTFELTGRGGVRFHLLSRNIPTQVAGARPVRELPPSRRIVLRDRVLVEQRNFFYSGSGSGSDSSVRFRNRLEFLAPLNKANVSDDGARYILADWEWFVPLGDPQERFASRQRIRAGVGYRRNFAWRFELLYIWNRSRNTIGEGFTTSDNIIDIRFKRVF
jgi:hypothetical protein